MGTVPLSGDIVALGHGDGSTVRWHRRKWIRIRCLNRSTCYWGADFGQECGCTWYCSAGLSQFRRC